MKVQVLGSGCPTCKKLHELTEKAVEELQLKEKVEYITGAEGMQKIIEMGVMSSPVLAVDGKPVMVGFSHDIEKVKGLLKEAHK
jgi:small redox-active disulfide protein 2